MSNPRRLRVIADHINDTTRGPVALHIHTRGQAATLGGFFWGLAVGLLPWVLEWIMY